MLRFKSRENSPHTGRTRIVKMPSGLCYGYIRVYANALFLGLLLLEPATWYYVRLMERNKSMGLYDETYNSRIDERSYIDYNRALLFKAINLYLYK